MRRRFENNFNSGVEEGDIVQFEESTTYTFPFNCVVDLFLVGGGGEVEVVLLMMVAIMDMVDVVDLL